MRFSVKNVVLLFCACSTIMLTQVAKAENALSSIQINPSGNSYQIILHSDVEVPVKKVVESSNKIYFELQDIEPTTSVNTIYNNVPNVDNVVVQPISKNSIKIIVQGKNADKSKLSFQTLNSIKKDIISQPKKQSLELNPPIESYAPIFQEDEPDLNSTANIFSGSLAIIKKQLDNLANSKMLLHVLGFALILFFGTRALKKEHKVDDEIKIGLSKNLHAQIPETPKTLRSETAFHRNSTRLPKRIQHRSPSMNYGLKTYQNAQKNPYASQINPLENTASKQSFKRTTVPVSSREIKSKIAPDLKSQVMTAALNSHASASPVVESGTGVDSIKFLESMTKIYEKNGRPDLAAGLRDNLRKAQERQR